MDPDTQKKVAKYEKKIAKTLRKLKDSSVSDSDDSGDETDKKTSLRLKIEKYRRKIGALTSAEGDSDSDSVAPAVAVVEKKEVDKSGMSLLLFYAYVEPAWSPHRHNDTIGWAEATLTSLGVTGRLRVAREGFNGTLTGPYDGIRGFCAQLRERDNGYFADMNEIDDFKITDNLPLGQAFPKLKVFAVSELVNYGIGVDGAPSTKNGGVHLPPREYHKKLLEDNTVVIDVRNSYEADIGRFAPAHGAKYIDPQMRVSTEFPGWAKDNIESLKDKQVLMYCTGGIRCERASALMRSLGHEQVYQLKGGIHNYLSEYAKEGGGLWVGKNYTFDKRFAHGAENKEEGGAEEPALGVDETCGVRADEVEITEPVISRCTACSIPWDKFRGKRRCPICGVPLLLCPECVKSGAPNAKCFLCQDDEKAGRRFDKRQHFNDLIATDLEKLATSGKTNVNLLSKKRIRGIHTCGVCEDVFTSRNSLFKHIKETGHANRKSKKKKLA